MRRIEVKARDFDRAAGRVKSRVRKPLESPTTIARAGHDVILVTRHIYALEAAKRMLGVVGPSLEPKAPSRRSELSKAWEEVITTGCRAPQMK